MAQTVCSLEKTLNHKVTFSEQICSFSCNFNMYMLLKTNDTTRFINPIVKSTAIQSKFSPHLFQFTYSFLKFLV